MKVFTRESQPIPPRVTWVGDGCPITIKSPSMKPNTILKSFEDLAPNMFEPEPDQPAPTSPKPAPASVQELPQTHFPILLPAYSGFAGYPRWGLNE
jgi:hypothetical protein